MGRLPDHGSGGGGAAGAAKVVRIVAVEDDADDYEMLLRELSNGGLSCDVKRTQTAAEFEGALGDHDPDVVISDYSLPTFDGFKALEICRRLRPATPFIFVSGTMGEETAVSALTHGAADYLLKGQTRRLCAAVRRAIDSAKERAERARLEARLAQTGRMEALGRLAGGVAHDFNNLLTAIVGYADAALEHLDAAHPANGDLREIRAAGERAATLTSQLLAFSRKQIVERRTFRLSDVVRGAEALLRRLVGADVVVETRLLCGGACVRADFGSLEQALVNLVANARDAMPRGGRVVVETRVADGDAASGLSGPEAAPTRHVALSVSDEGVGIAAEALERIFEPFYTTKTTGTGLGLATVHGVVEQFGGSVVVESAPGRGATFTVRLPLVDAAPERAADRATAVPRAGDGETVLLVEDEEIVRRLAARALRERGYVVLEAGDGDAALEMLGRHPETRMLVTDVVMPRLGGVELAARVRNARPDLRVLFLSGYPGDLVLRSEEERRRYAFLPKPFTSKTLALKVGEMFEDGGGEPAANPRPKSPS